MKFNSRAIHAHHQHEKVYGAHTTPIYQTSTFIFESADQGGKRFSGLEDGYIYTRLGNPNMTEVGMRVADLEGAEKGLVTSSGMSAISTVLMKNLSSGDHIITSNCIYGCSFGFITEVLPQYDIEVDAINLADEELLIKKIKSNTKIIYFETPANPTLQLIDIDKICKIAKKNNIKVVVDNTFMTPYLQRPIELGADIVVHSATKYIGGHGDVIAGIIVGSSEEIDIIALPYLKDFGGSASPFDAWLLMRGIKTLGLRMERHCANAQKVAEYLENHPKISKVYYPGLKSFAYKDIVKKQMYGTGGMVAFEMKDGYEAGKKLMDNVKMLSLAVSLGTIDSLIQHPASMTHSPVPAEDRIRCGITDGLVRISVGLEDVEDIINDLDQALATI